MTPRTVLNLLVSVVLAWGFCAGVAGAAEMDRDEVFIALTKSGDAHIDASIAGRANGGFPGSRGFGAQYMVFAAGYANKVSRFYHDPSLVPYMTELARQLRAAQLPDGLWGDAGNIDSPPDSAFILKTLAKGQWFLGQDNHDSTAALRAGMKTIILACAEGVRTGGIHTPNHRWAVCTALAHVNELYPGEKWIARVEEWLAEGVDVDEDGQWAERSPHYTGDVNNPSLLELAILLRRPALLEGVRRSLEMTLFHTEVNGEVETVASRRQDQRAGMRKYIWEYYFPFRYLAVHDRNGRFAAMAARIERDFLEEVGARVTNMNSVLTCALRFPARWQPLPAVEPLEENYAKFFPRTALARIRRGSTTGTIYGGSDWRSGLGIGSGLAMNPAFFKLRKGAAILESVRMTPAFFSTGFFYSDGLQPKGAGYVLSQELKVPYHLPLPVEKRRADGQYELSADMGAQGSLGRYFSKMSFADRPSQFRTLKSEVAIREKDGAFELAFQVTSVDGLQRIPVTIELAFRAGGKLAGVEPLVAVTRDQAGENRLGPARAPGPASAVDPGRGSRGGSLGNDENSYLLRQGQGTYTVGNDTIQFGPGSFSRPPGRMEGEAYSWMEGSLRVEGERVYLTGLTPFNHTLTFR